MFQAPKGRRAIWPIEQIDVAPYLHRFDDWGDEQRLTRLTSDAVDLCSALELVRVKPGRTQVQLCMTCGIDGCEFGGWVVLRQIAGKVAWIPFLDPDAWEKGSRSFDPPTYCESNGIPLFNAQTWLQVRQVAPTLPRAEELPWPTSREIALVCQWMAMGEILGKAPAAPRLRRDLLVIATEGEVEVEAEKVDAFLERAFNSPTAVQSARADAAIEFWLDLERTPAWQSFGYVRGEVCFLLDDLALLPAPSTTCERRE